MKSLKAACSRRLLLAVLVLLSPGALVLRAADNLPAPSAAGGRLPLDQGWSIQSSVLAGEDGAVISSVGYLVREWTPAAVPGTVLGALVKTGVYPDPRVGLNAFRIPDSSDEFNRRHDLAKFSHLPGQRNPWRDPYWYRTEFELPRLAGDRRVWLHFDAINYRAEVWVNGARVADRSSMAGMFQRFQFDVTEFAKSGRNALAVKVYPVDHPGTPDTQRQVLGPDRGYVGKEIMRDVTEIMTIGYDCMMTVPDRNMGLWQPVWISFSGPVQLRDPFVVTDLPLPETNRATLAISAELTNTTAQSVNAVLRGRVAGTGVRFAQSVELGAGEARSVAIEPAPRLRNPRLWWPVNYGEQHLYELLLSAEVDGRASDEARVSFGVREVGYEMHEINGWHGRRMLVNGQKIFCRGGYIQPELMFDWDARRMEAEIRYYAAANLNLIYFEDIPNPPAPFLELCDRYGLLFGNVFYSCYWLRPGTLLPGRFCTCSSAAPWTSSSATATIPAWSLYMAMNEEDTQAGGLRDVAPAHPRSRRHPLVHPVGLFPERPQERPGVVPAGPAGGHDRQGRLLLLGRAGAVFPLGAREAELDVHDGERLGFAAADQQPEPVPAGGQPAGGRPGRHSLRWTTTGRTTAPTTTSRATTRPCAGCTASRRAWPTTAGKATW